jgi:hypothetical protein
MFRNLTDTQVLGGLAFCLLAGESVDGQTVSATIKPDTSPDTNWKQLGCIKNVGFEKKEQAYTTSCPGEAGGYEDDTTTFVTEDMIILESDHMNDIVHQLQYGLTAPPTPGTEQAIFAKANRELYGWLKLQARKLDGSDLLLMDVWCKITLRTGYKFQNGLTANALSFKALKSAGNGILFN